MTQQVFTAKNYANYTYDNIGQLKTAQGFESGTTPRLHEQFGYAYDKAWNLSERTNNALIQSFTVNDVNELSSASQSGTLTVSGTTTEPGGNVTSVTVNGQAASEYADGSFAAPGFALINGQTNYTAIAQDNLYPPRMSTNSVTVNVASGGSYTYDANGNLLNDGTRSFVYNDEDELISVWTTNGWSNSFAYDGLMRKRIERQFSWSGSGWTETNEVHYIYDGSLVLQERDENNEPLTTYTRGIDLSVTLQDAGGIGGLLGRSDNQKIVPTILLPENPNPQNVVTSYYFSDDGGNVSALVSPAGMILAQYKYDPFGNLISKSGLMADINKFRYSGKEWEDNAGLYNYGYRFYEPSLQRWMNRDPLGELGFEVLKSKGNAQTVRTFTRFAEWAQGADLYSFVSNEPLSRGDCLGLDSSTWPPPLPPTGNCEPIDLANCEAACALVGLVTESCHDQETWKFRGIENNQLVFDVHHHIKCDCSSPRWPPPPTSCTSRNAPPDLPPHSLN
ncbi:MAG TPA: RHS repeat-associated core domain-containing protein [Verrucomicrobiae bacterium]|nr:RHS repeat-associated core domain-containing protein [Verrucomicrobiae bacterium]